jgi:hypothetical protein
VIALALWPIGSACSKGGGSGAGGAGGTIGVGGASGPTGAGGAKSDASAGGSGAGVGGHAGAGGAAGVGGSGAVDAGIDVVNRGDARTTPKLSWTLTTSGWDAAFISGTAGGELWIATRTGSALQIRADGSSNSTLLNLLANAFVTGLWVAAANDAYISANANVVLHWDGSGTWKRDVMASGRVFPAVWGSSPTDVYAAAGAEVYHSTGNDQWTLQTLRDLPLGPLAALTGTGPNDLWLAGAEGEIYRSTGDGMWPQETKTGVFFVNQLWAASPSEAYFVTNTAVAHRRPGGAWVTEPTPRTDNELILSIWGSGPTDIYAGTDQGHLFHSVGDGVWQNDGFDAGPGLTIDINGIWGRSATDVYLATSLGIYHGQR